MDNTAPVPILKPFIPHPSFSDEVNRDIVQSEIEGGVYLDALAEGAVLEESSRSPVVTPLSLGPGTVDTIAETRLRGRHSGRSSGFGVAGGPRVASSASAAS